MDGTNISFMHNYLMEVGGFSYHNKDALAHALSTKAIILADFEHIMWEYNEFWSIVLASNNDNS